MDTMTMDQLHDVARAHRRPVAQELKGLLMTDERDLTTADVARITGQSIATVTKLLRLGRFPGAYRTGLGGSNAPWRVPQRSLEAYRQTMSPRP